MSSDHFSMIIEQNKAWAQPRRGAVLARTGSKLQINHAANKPRASPPAPLAVYSRRRHHLAQLAYFQVQLNKRCFG